MTTSSFHADGSMARVHPQAGRGERSSQETAAHALAAGSIDGVRYEDCSMELIIVSLAETKDHPVSPRTEPGA